MTKLFGAIFIISASVLTGFSIGTKLHERVRLLTALRIMLQRLRRELSVSMPEYIQMFENDRDELTKPISSRIVTELKGGGTPSGSVKLAFSSAYSVRLLKSDEREFFSGVLSMLGEGSLSGAEDMLTNADEQIRQFILSAQEEEKNRSRVSLALSVYIGLAAAILLS